MRVIETTWSDRVLVHHICVKKTRWAALAINAEHYTAWNAQVPALSGINIYKDAYR